MRAYVGNSGAVNSKRTNYIPVVWLISPEIRVLGDDRVGPEVNRRAQGSGWKVVTSHSATCEESAASMLTAVVCSHGGS